jgi:UDP-glucuronate decarboxylase
VLVRGRLGEPYNVGIDRPEISMARLAETVIATARELFDYRGKVVLGKAAEPDYLVDNPNRRCPVIDKAREHLGYAPKVLVDEGVYRSLVWYHHNPVADAA